MTAAITLQHVDIGVAQKTIVRDISIDIPEGKITTIIGPNGCGKSTTLKAICRMLPVTAGSITLKGKAVQDYKYRELARVLAILTQSPLSPEDLTVYDLVSMGRFPYQGFLSRHNQDDDHWISWAMAETGVSRLAPRLLHTLSGGERQRAWIAMALAQKPSVLLLDEPTTYLDICHQLEVLQLVKRLNAELGLTVVLVLHDLNQAVMFSDLVVVLQQGRLVTAGAPQDVVSAELLRDVFNVKADPFTASNGTPVLVPYDLYDARQRVGGVD